MNETLIRLRDFAIARLQEPTTWRGIVLVITAIGGIKAPPEYWEAIITIGLMVAGVIGAVVPDKKP